MVEALRAREDSLMNDSATIERLARERYGLIRDGEKLYRFVEDDSSKGQAPRAKDDSSKGQAPSTKDDSAKRQAPSAKRQ